MIRHALLSLSALALCVAPAALRAQSFPCPAQPVPSFVRIADTLSTVERDVATTRAGSCVGVVTRVLDNGLTRYAVQWPPCVTGGPWRSGALYATRSTARSNAAKSPPCVQLPPPVDTIVPPPPPPPPPPGGRPQVFDQTPVVCAYGNGCIFSGVRDVTLIGTAGTAIARDVRGFIGIGCGTGYFNNVNVGTGLRCEAGPMKRVTMANPMPGMNGFGPTFEVPLGYAGTTENRAGSSGGFNGTRVQDGLGATRMKCELHKLVFDDPLVYPGQPGKSHLHYWYGNTAPVSANITPANIRDASNGSTCLGGALNKSAYWIPAPC